MAKFKELTKEQQIIVNVLNTAFLESNSNPLTILRKLQEKLEFKLKSKN